MRRLAALFLLALVAFSPAQEITAEKKEAVLKEMETIITKRAFTPGVDFKKWPDIITSKKEDIEKATDIPAFTRVLNSALREFGISHFRLMTPVAASQRGQTSRVGSGASVAPSKEGLAVRGLAESGPAKAAGLEVGDTIIKVNGETVTDPTKLEGEEGKKVQVEVKKANGEIKTVEIELKKYSTVRKETLTWQGDDVAVLRVFTFSTGYDRANIENLVKEANEKKAKTLVLDLRSNGGGAVNNLNHLLSLLMPDKTEYGTFVSRTLMNQYIKANPDAPTDVVSIAKWVKQKAATRKRDVEPFSGDIVVLTNRGSGSASEICALALRENVNAKIVGAKSAGAVLASVYGKLPEGFALQYPVSDFISIKGVRLEKNPLVPDVEVSGQSQNGEDLVLQRALEVARAEK